MSYFNLTTNETTTNFTDETYSAAFELTIQNFVLAIFLIALNVLIIFGNIFVILAICIDFHLRSPTHHLLGSLAVADLLLGNFVLSCFQVFKEKNIQWIISVKLINDFLPFVLDPLPIEK